ncbi:MAG: DinB family protein, partial [Bacteroidota bacterium]
SLFSAFGCRMNHDSTGSTANPALVSSTEGCKSIDTLNAELLEAWHRSEGMTMANIQQMPPELFSFKYAKEAMSFSEQWRHCIIYTCGQLAGRIGIENPYENIKLPVQMPKEDVVKELKKMYAHVRKSISGLSEEKLLSNCDFAGETIPVWRLFYAMENHIIHHRGQCVVYLRLKGIVPQGYYGW